MLKNHPASLFVKLDCVHADKCFARIARMHEPLDCSKQAARGRFYIVRVCRNLCFQLSDAITLTKLSGRTLRRTEDRHSSFLPGQSVLQASA
jgi:hypothetical protein